MRRHTVIISAAVALLVVVLLVVGALVAGGPDDPDEPDPDAAPSPAASHLVVGLDAHPGDLDPHVSTSAAGRLVLEQVHDTLVGLGHDLLPRPGLATTWEADEDLATWTFRLRDGARFHDGSPVTAEDVVASLERIRDEGTDAHHLDVVEEVRAVDGATVEIGLTRPAADLPARLAASPRLAIVPASWLDSERAAPAPGTGPFRLDGDDTDDGRVVLVAAEQHWAGSPILERLEFVVAPDPQRRLRALRDGQLHWAADLDPEQVAEIEDDEQLRVVRRRSVDHWFLGFNVDLPPLDDVEVRRALALALDRREIAEAVRPGAASPTQTAIPLGSAWFHRHEPRGHAPEQARERLEDAGVESLELDVLATEDLPESVDLAGVVVEQLQAVGVEASVRTLPFDELLEELPAGRFALYTLGWTGGPDPDGVYRPVHHSEGERNYHGLADDRLDEWLDAARREPDRQARAELYRRVAERAAALAAHVELYHPHVLHAAADEVQGGRLRADGLVRFDAVRLMPPGDDQPEDDGDGEGEQTDDEADGIS